MTTGARPSRFGTRDLVETFGADRVCGDAACTTALSRYNDLDVCGVHTPRPASRRKKTSSRH